MGFNLRQLNPFSHPSLSFLLIFSFHDAKISLAVPSLYIPTKNLYKFLIFCYISSLSQSSIFGNTDNN
jgi:hypothetical protein